MKDTFKIKKNFQFKKSFLKTISKECKIEEDEEFYTLSEFKNKNYVIHSIAFEIVQYLYKNNLKEMLSKELSNEQIKKVLKNHEEKTYEKNHLAFLLKIKIDLYLINNDTLNIKSFLNFNAKKIYEELEQIAELEIDADGEFLEEDDFADIDTNVDEKYLQFIAFGKYLKMKDPIDDIIDLHIFKTKKNEYKIFNEYGKPIELDIDISIKNLAEQIYEKELKIDSKEFVLTRLSVYLCCTDPERIILYGSLGDDMDEFIKDFTYFKINLNLNCECYKSSESQPS